MSFQSVLLEVLNGFGLELEGEMIISKGRLRSMRIARISQQPSTCSGIFIGELCLVAFEGAIEMVADLEDAFRSLDIDVSINAALRHAA